MGKKALMVRAYITKDTIKDKQMSHTTWKTVLNLVMAQCEMINRLLLLAIVPKGVSYLSARFCRRECRELGCRLSRTQGIAENGAIIWTRKFVIL